MLRALKIAAVLTVAAAAAAWAWQSAVIREASGVVRMGDSLLIVDDSEIGAYFKVTIGKLPGPLFDLNKLKPQRIALRDRGLGVDIESIGVMADGRVALLSERLRSLVSDSGIIAEYDSELAEMGKRGLEGLAIRPLPAGASRVAVVWEGGYPDFGRLPRRAGAGHAWLPLIVVHDVPRNGHVGRVRLKDAIASIELSVPRPAGEEPAAQRFRAPDLVWTKLGSPQTDGEDWGFIVLLSSQNGLPQPSFTYKWLQRFDMEGRPVGQPFDLANRLPPALAGVNWEGLDWFEQGRKLVLVHEGDSKVQPHAFVVDLPPGWQFNPAK